MSEANLALVRETDRKLDEICRKMDEIGRKLGECREMSEYTLALLLEVGRTPPGALPIRPVSTGRETGLLEVLKEFDDALGAEFVPALERGRPDAELPPEHDA